jgi:hypothetical protein
MSEMPPPPDSTPPPMAPPPVPAAAPPPAPPASMPASGALGRPRSALLVILLAIITFGIWTWVWSFQNGDELKRHTGRGVGGIGYFLITLIVYPVTMFLMASEVEQLYRNEGKEPPITTIWGLWFLVPLIGNLIWYLRIQGALNDYWTSKGATP